MVHWRKISGNPDVFEKLKQLLESGEAVGFVGAGASAGLYPLWPQLIGELADEAVKRGKATESSKKVWLGLDALQAARQIRQKLGEGEFAELIRVRFGPKMGASSQRYTTTHAALARLGLRGFVTTNYDSALTFACHDRCPGRVVQAFDWRHERVGLWLQGRAGDAGELPILHAHGQHDASKSIVLDAEDYRRAYGDDRYRLLFEQLWTRERLVVVGHSLREAWLQVVVEQALTRAGTREVGARRHFALLPLLVEDICDTEAVDAVRDSIEEPYHLRALFYPVTPATGHSALHGLLEDLLTATSSSKPTVVPTPAPKADPLADWFQLVQDEHRRLGDGFERPPELNLLEQAWVQVMVQPAAGKAREEAESEILRGPTTLDEVLKPPIGKPSWNVGRWLLEGPPGSGKTTLLRHLAARLAEEASAECVPVFVSLPRLVETGEEVLRFATGGLDSASAPGVLAALSKARDEGRLVLLLDSYDEVPRGERRDRADRRIRALQKAPWNACKLVVSSRPIGRGDTLDDLPRLDLLPLDEARRREFLEKWLRHAEHAEWETEAGKAMAHLLAHRGLRDLSGIPLYLTLLATLWQQGVPPSDNLARLYDQIFDLLLNGGHRKDSRPMPIQDTVLEALRHLAYGMTEDDHWAEPARRLEARLRSQTELCRQLGCVEEWRRDLHAFLRDVHEETQILGPHDGAKGDWRFWHRTFREALTAEQLRQQHEQAGPDALVTWAGQLKEGGEGRWAEPLALLTGRLAEPDALVLRVGEANRKLALRAAAFAQGLKPETVVALLQMTDNLAEREQLYEGIPDQLADASACLALVEQLREGCRNGFDLFWLWWIVEEVERRWHPGPAAKDLLDGFFRHISPPKDADLLRKLRLPQGGQVDLWCKIPEGEGWVGSPEDEDGRFGDESPRHRVRILRPFWLGAGPVTNAQYAAFDPSKPFESWDGVPEDQLPAHPRVNVTWYEAVSFCRWLATLPGFAGTSPRLPMEEEWEYACRAGTPTRFWRGNGEEDLAEIGWFGGNAGGRTHRVGGKPANEWGLYDVHGNVREWTASPYEANRYHGRQQNPPHPVDPAALPADLAASPRGGRVMRGGSFWDPAQWCRSAYRDVRDPGLGFRYQGFRVLLSSAPSRG